MADELIDSGAGDGGGESTPSDTSHAEMSSDQLAQNPEIQAAWSRVFGGGGEQSNDNGEAEATAGDEAAEGAEGREPEPTPAKKPTAPVKPAAKEVAAAEPAASTLSPLLRSVAMRANWSQEDIDGFYEQNPELAERTFERLHKSQNDLSMRFAQLGAARLNPQQQQQVAQQQIPQTVRQSQLDALLGDEALKKFGEENGQDFVEKFLKPFKQEMYEPVRQVLAFVENQKRELLAQQINGVFSELEKDFGDHYGTSAALTDAHKQVRLQTAQLADQIHAGAALQGVNLSVEDALKQAHLVLTAERRAEIERKNLTQQITKRSGRLTNRPNAPRTGKTVGEGSNKSEAAAMEAYSSKAAELDYDV